MLGVGSWVEVGGGRVMVVFCCLIMAFEGGSGEAGLQEGCVKGVGERVRVAEGSQEGGGVAFGAGQGLAGRV